MAKKQDIGEVNDVMLDLSPGNLDFDVMPVLKHFTKELLCNILSYSMRCLKKAKVHYTESSPIQYIRLMERAIESAPEALRVEELKTIICLLSGSLANIRNYAQNVEPGIMQIWELLCTNRHVKYTQIAEILGRPIDIKFTSDWYCRPAPEFWLLPAEAINTHGYYYRQYSLTEKKEALSFALGKKMRGKAIRSLLPPDITRPVFTDELPKGNFTIESFEEDIPTDIFLLSSLNAVGKITGATTSITATRVAALAKKFTTPDFSDYIGDDDVTRHNLLAVSGISMAQYLAGYSNSRLKIDSIIDFAHFVVFNMMQNIEGPAFQAFIPGFKGFNKTWTQYSRAYMYMEIVRKLLTQEAGKWLSLYNIQLLITLEWCKNESSPSDISLFTDSAISDARLQRINDNRRFNSIDWDEEVTWRFVNSLLKLLNACGIIDAAYNDRTGKMMHIRLTDLGLYTLGLSKTYINKTQKKLLESLDFDPVNPIITVVGDASPFMALLQSYAEPIGSNRFRVSPATLMRECTNSKEVQERVVSFQNTICNNPTGIWKQIIDNTLLRADCTLPVAKKYMLYPLNPKVPGLVDFINHNPMILKHVIRAEHNLLLVEDTFNEHFFRIMRNAGYMID